MIYINIFKKWGITYSANTDDVQTFLKRFILINADGTIILAESENQLWNALNIYDDYFETWKSL